MNRQNSEFSNLLRWVINPWVIGGAFVISLVLLVATLLMLMLTRPPAPQVVQPTAVLITIPAPTATPIPPTPTLFQTPTPSVAAPPAPGSGELYVGGYAAIANTGGDGLRLRVDPGLNGEVRLLGAESEVFLIKDGPKEVDGFTWWYLEGPEDKSRSGWAVANYLAPAPAP